MSCCDVAYITSRDLRCCSLFSSTGMLRPAELYFFSVPLSPKADYGLVFLEVSTRVGTLIEATIDLQLIQNRYMFRSFTVLHCSHQHCLQHVASDVEVVG